MNATPFNGPIGLESMLMTGYTEVDTTTTTRAPMLEVDWTGGGEVSPEFDIATNSERKNSCLV